MSTPLVVALLILALVVIWIVRCEVRTYRRHGVRGALMSALFWLTPW